VNWFRANARSAWIIGLTLLVPVVFYCNILFDLVSVRQAYQSDIERIAPRVARLQGLIEHEDSLRLAAERAERLMVDLVYPVTEDRAAVSARLQQDVRQMLVDSGLSVSNSQVLPVREQAMFDYIGLKVTVSGSIAAFDSGLAALSAHQPLLLVESIEVWPNRTSRHVKGDKQTPQFLSATLQLLALRAVQ
jgi:general secretion pathway protein M